MDALKKIYDFVVMAWDWLDGNKTDLGLKLGGIALAIMSAQNFFDFHPSWLAPVIDWMAKIATYLTGGGLAHKGFKAVSAMSEKSREANAVTTETK